MTSLRILINSISKQNPKSRFPFSLISLDLRQGRLAPPQHYRLISSTTVVSSWMDSIKGAFTGKKEEPKETSESFTLGRFADELKNFRKVGALKQFMVGRSSEATMADTFDKIEAIIRYLNGIDPSGQNLKSSQKQEAAKHCNCTITDVENALAKFTWAKIAHEKVLKLKEEGKPLPTSMQEIQKLVGSTAMDLARSNLAESGQISRNAPCPCGSKKRYKWCCGKDDKVKSV